MPRLLAYPRKHYDRKISRTRGHHAMDWWEYPVCDLGLSGPDKGKGGKYIIVGPEEDLGKYKDKADYAFQSRTQKLFIGFRVLNPGETAIKEFLSKVKIYPLGSEAKVPSQT